MYVTPNILVALGFCIVFGLLSYGKRHSEDSCTVHKHVADLKPRDLARCSREYLLEALKIQEKETKRNKKETERQNAIMRPYFAKRNSLQKQIDDLRLKLDDPETKVSEKLDISDDIRKLQRGTELNDREIEKVQNELTRQ